MNSLIAWGVTFLILGGLTVAVVESERGVLGRWFAAGIGTLMIIGAVATNVDIYTPVWMALLAVGYAMGLLNRIVSLVLLVASGLFAFSWGVVEEKGVVAVGGYLTLSILMTFYECHRPSHQGKPKDTG